MNIVPSPYAALLARIPVAERRVRIDEREVAYWEYGTPGDGPTLLFVHGFRGDHHGLEPVIAYLPGAHIIAPDLPGFGASEPMAREHSIAGYADWLRVFAPAIGLGGDTVLVGHSFGTMVVAHAIADGLPAARAVLINPIAAPALEGPNALGTRLTSFYYEVGKRLPERLGQALLTNRAILRGASVTLAKTKEPALRRWIHNQHDRYFSGYANRRVVVEAYEASVTHDLTEQAAQLRLPVHLIAGEHDDIAAVSSVRALADRLPDASIIVVPGVGHLIHYETPKPAAQEIARVTAARVAS